jgi:hypothetical protein
MIINIKCEICNGLGRDDVECQLLTTFRFILTAFERNPDTEKTKLYNIIGRLQDCLVEK